jgi:hypothetical protein
VEWKGLFAGNCDSELAQGIFSARHESFATGFVDGWNRSIRQHHAQAATARCNGRRQASWSAADNEYIHRIRKAAQYGPPVDLPFQQNKF